jgi:hypothetical protein
MNRSRPQTRQFREREQAQNRPPTRFSHVREQSTNGFSPRAQTRQQTVHIRAQATALTVCDQAAGVDTNCPQAIRGLALSTTGISPLPEVVNEPRLAKKSPCRRIVVSILPPITFPVHIRILPVYDLI